MKKNVSFNTILYCLSILVVLTLLLSDLKEQFILQETPPDSHPFSKLESSNALEPNGNTGIWNWSISLDAYLHGMLILILVTGLIVTRKFSPAAWITSLYQKTNYFRGRNREGNPSGEISLQFRKNRRAYRSETCEQNSDFINEDSLFRQIGEIDIHGNLEQVMVKFKQILDQKMKSDKLGLAFLDREGKYNVETIYETAWDLKMETFYKGHFDGKLLRRLLHDKESLIINNLENFAVKNPVSQLTMEMINQDYKACVIFPIRFKGHCVGYVLALRKEGTFCKLETNFGYRVLDAIKHKLYMEYILQYIVVFISQAFVKISHEKDDETARHIQRMSRYSHIIACKYYEKNNDIPPRLIREILWFAPLHDIGKIGIPDYILNKPGCLSAEERKKMQRHVTIGEEVIRQISDNLLQYSSLSLMEMAAEIISSHHEKFDGTGYPRGLSGQEIPIAGRIIAIADVFDALTSKRSYKKAFSIKAALLIMKEDMSGHFDPEVFKCFEESLKEIESVYEYLKEV